LLEEMASLTGVARGLGTAGRQSVMREMAPGRELPSVAAGVIIWLPNPLTVKI